VERGIKMPKVFRMNDFDWVAANNLKEAVEWYNNFTSDDEVEERFVEEVEDLTNFYVTVDRYGNEEFEEDYLENEEDTTMSVPGDELLEKEWKGKPYLFCSTEY
jgi:hypothetical protein